jgi:hypothetical protein
MHGDIPNDDNDDDHGEHDCNDCCNKVVYLSFKIGKACFRCTGEFRELGES